MRKVSNTKFRFHFANIKFRRPVADVRGRCPRFELRAAHVGFVLDKMALKQIFLLILVLSSVKIISPMLHILSFIISGMVKGPISGPQFHRGVISPYLKNIKIY